MNTDSLIEHAIKRRDDDAKSGIIYSDVWCVLDRDSFPLHNYGRAFQLADGGAIKIAWANEAFELWYLMHFNYIDSAMSRTAYSRILLDNGVDYTKADYKTFDTIKPQQAIAMKNARRLEKHWNDLGKRLPHQENPSTNIHNLVEFLNDLAELGTDPT